MKQEGPLWQLLEEGNGWVCDRVRNSSLSLVYIYYFHNKVLKEGLGVWINTALFQRGRTSTIS